MKAVIYARYSSRAQRDVSIDQQIAACKDFAARGGIDIAQIYTDRALTGTNDRRPEFQRMILDAKRGEWQYVIVYTLDRFSRDRYDSAVYKRQLRNCGVKVLSAMEQITDDPTGVIMESILEGYAEYYSKELSRKVRRGHEDNARKCMVNGALPLGYKKGPDGRYAVEEQGAAIVQEIFRRVGSGEPLIRIMDDLNARGIRTKKGAAWNKSSLNRMLTNDRYIGYYRYQDMVIKDGIPAIVTAQEWSDVQERIRTKSNPRRSADGAPRSRRREDGIYLLTGKLFCGECDNPLVGVSGTSKSGSLHHYYRCKGHADGCVTRNVRRDDVELEISKAIRSVLLTEEGILEIAHTSYQHQLQARELPDVDLLEAQLAETKRSLKNIMAAIEQGIFTATTRDRLQELEDRQAQISMQLDAARQNADDLISEAEIAETMRFLARGDITDKVYQESLIDAFLVRAYVYADRYEIFFSPDPNKPTTIPLSARETSSAALGCSYKLSDIRPNSLMRTNTTQVVFVEGLFRILSKRL